MSGQARRVGSDWNHVLRLNVDRGPLEHGVLWATWWLPHIVQDWIRTCFPGPFLPGTVIIKKLKAEWEEEFDTEIRMYNKLKPIQGQVVPVFHGEVGADGTRALLLSDVGGKHLGAITDGEYSEEEIERMVRASLKAILNLGVVPYDANLVNCLVTEDRVVVDHEQDEDVEAGGDTLDELLDSKAEEIMYWYRYFHKPQPQPDTRCTTPRPTRWSPSTALPPERIPLLLGPKGPPPPGRSYSLPQSSPVEADRPLSGTRG